jgi:hypothetical protein
VSQLHFPDVHPDMLRSIAFALVAGASLVLSISAFAETPGMGSPGIKARVIHLFRLPSFPTPLPSQTRERLPLPELPVRSRCFPISNSLISPRNTSATPILPYPVPEGGAAPVVADAVYPYPDTPGGAFALDTTSSVLSQTYTFPTNIESAYLDVVAQS